MRWAAKRLRGWRHVCRYSKAQAGLRGGSFSQGLVDVKGSFAIWGLLAFRRLVLIKFALIISWKVSLNLIRASVFRTRARVVMRKNKMVFSVAFQSTSRHPSLHKPQICVMCLTWLRLHLGWGSWYNIYKLCETNEMLRFTRKMTPRKMTTQRLNAPYFKPLAK